MWRSRIYFFSTFCSFLAYDVSEVSTVLTIENGIIEVQKAINFTEAHVFVGVKNVKSVLGFGGGDDDFDGN